MYHRAFHRASPIRNTLLFQVLITVSITCFLCFLRRWPIHFRRSLFFNLIQISVLAKTIPRWIERKKKKHQHIDGMEKAGGIVTSLKTQQCSLVTKSLWYIMMFCFHPEKRNVWLDFAFTKPLTFRHQTEQYGRRLLTVSCLRLHFFYYFFFSATNRIFQLQSNGIINISGFGGKTVFVLDNYFMYIN